MLVVISDLHFQDATNDAVYDNYKGPSEVGRNVSRNAFDKVFAEILTAAKKNKAQELIIVLAGDIFDLNRSQKWLAEDVRPYGKDKPDKWCPVADAILTDIIKNNDQTFKLFKNMAGQTLENGSRIIFEYLPGNHDRIINLDPALRKRVRGELLGQSDPHDAEFDHVYWSEKYGVLIRHGHEYDRFNFAGDIPEEGVFKIDPADYARAPLGDFVVIDIEAGLAWEFRRLHEKEVMSGKPRLFRDIYNKLLEFDDLRPQSDLFDFLQAETPADVDVWKYIDSATDNVLKKALNSKFLRSRLEMRAKLTLLSVKLLPMKLWPTKFIIRHVITMDSEKEPWQYAQREEILGGDAGRYVAAGHTHFPTVEFLKHRASDGKELFFFDTGTWRQQIRKCRDCRDSMRFARAKALTYVAFYSSEEDQKNAPEGKGYSFDYWSGFTKKEPAA